MGRSTLEREEENKSHIVNESNYESKDTGCRIIQVLTIAISSSSWLTLDKSLILIQIPHLHNMEITKPPLSFVRIRK